MTPSEQEEILRRALHAVADAIEPAPDGLERIRERLSRPRPLAVAWLMAGWTGLAQPLLLRVEPVLAGAAGRLSDRLAEWLRIMVRSLGAAADRLRPAGVRLHLWVERLRPLGGLLVDAIRMLRPGSGMSRHEKLRAALAFGAAALIGAAGGFGLSEGVPPVISTVSAALGTGDSGPSASADGHGSESANTALPILPTSGSLPGITHGPNLAPRPACSPTPNPSADPTPSTSSPTPAPSTSSPTPAPSTSSPTPAPSTSSPTPAPSTSTPPSSSPPGPGPSPAINASAGVGTGVPTSSAAPQSSGVVNDGSIGTRPFATPTPTTGANTKPAPSPTTSGCG